MWNVHIVTIPKQQEIAFPKICLRCLKPAEETIEVRSSQWGYLGIWTTKIGVPVCSECFRYAFWRYMILTRLIFWGGLVGGLYLLYLWQQATGINGWNIVALILLMTLLGFVKQEMPKAFGIEFEVLKGGIKFGFANPEYARIFAILNGGTLSKQNDPSRRSTN